ncbi:MAG: hypothetical protein CM1200mP26_18450 [Acidimicrobiales bacterium]|nr:MAG: hypothetical protein CM1200mP26_18450 [Acidimicrobiales bacterium]
MGLHAWVRDATDQLHNVQVQGPLSREILSEVIWTRPDQASIDELGWFRLSVARIGDEPASRSWCHAPATPESWDSRCSATHRTLQRSGMPSGPSATQRASRPWDSRHSTCSASRARARSSLAPSSTTRPPPGGRHRLHRPHQDQGGRLHRSRRPGFAARNTPSAPLGGLELTGDEPAGPGNPIMIARQQVGTITSGTRSPILGKNIALGWMAIEQPKTAPRSRWGRWTATRSASRPPLCASPTMTPTRSACGVSPGIGPGTVPGRLRSASPDQGSARRPVPRAPEHTSPRTRSHRSHSRSGPWPGRPADR